MRIITGIYKGRHFEIPRTFKARPTTDFAKENLFNVIRGYLDFDESTALDLFSGTGSISLELLFAWLRTGRECGERSRSCTLHPAVYREDRRPNHVLIRGDVFRFVKTCHEPFDLVFADPPYALPGTAYRARLGDKWRIAEARWHPRLRAWQTQRLLFPTLIFGAQKLRKCQLQYLLRHASCRFQRGGIEERNGARNVILSAKFKIIILCCRRVTRGVVGTEVAIDTGESGKLPRTARSPKRSSKLQHRTTNKKNRRLLCYQF